MTRPVAASRLYQHGRVRLLPKLLAVTGLVAVLCTGGSWTAPAGAAVPVPYEGPAWMARLAVVGDSMTWTTADVLKHTFRSEWWRPAVFSYPGVRTETMRDQIRGMASDRPDAFVVQLGVMDTLDLISGARSWASEQAQIAGAIADIQARGVPCVVWVGLDENVSDGRIASWSRLINAEIRHQLQLRGAGPFADWTATAAGHPELFLPDGAHLTPIGQQVYASMIAEELRDCARNPRGSLDDVQAGIGVRVKGWTFDPDTSASNSVHVYVDGTFRGEFRADTSRPDVAAVFGVSPNHGYDVHLAVGAGVHDVCVYAINAGPYGFTHPTLGCRRVSVSATPFGALDEVTRSGSSVTARGWAIDNDTTSATNVRLLVDGVQVGQGLAQGPRGDLAVVFPAYGGGHGFSMSASGLGPGPHEVCVQAVNATGTPGGDRLLGCRLVA